MHSSEYDAAKARYARHRRAAFTRVASDAARTGFVPDGFRLTDIDEMALSAWRRTWLASHPSGSGGWDWEAVSRPFRKNPSAFHVALWCSGRLCGLAVGDLSRKRSSGEFTTCTIHYIERAPISGNPLRGKVVALAVAAAETYAHSLGAITLRISNPLPGVVRVYAEMGFSVVRAGGRWCISRERSYDDP